MLSGKRFRLEICGYKRIHGQILRLVVERSPRKRRRRTHRQLAGAVNQKNTASMRVGEIGPGESVLAPERTMLRHARATAVHAVLPVLASKYRSVVNPKCRENSK